MPRCANVSVCLKNRGQGGVLCVGVRPAATSVQAIAPPSVYDS